MNRLLRVGFQVLLLLDLAFGLVDRFERDVGVLTGVVFDDGVDVQGSVEVGLLAEEGAGGLAVYGAL